MAAAGSPRWGMVLAMVGRVVAQHRCSPIRRADGATATVRPARGTRVQDGDGPDGDRAAAGDDLPLIASASRDQPQAWVSWLLTGASMVIVWRTRIHLLWLLGAGALMGALGWV